MLFCHQLFLQAFLINVLIELNLLQALFRIPRTEFYTIRSKIRPRNPRLIRKIGYEIICISTFMNIFMVLVPLFHTFLGSKLKTFYIHGLIDRSVGPCSVTELQSRRCCSFRSATNRPLGPSLLYRAYQNWQLLIRY